MLTVFIAVVGSVGWGLWFIGRRDVRDAREESRYAHAAAALARTESSSNRTAEAAATDAMRAADDELKVARYELSALRMNLSRCDADLVEARERIAKLEAERPERPSRMVLYGHGSGVRNRKDG